ncbi:MAG: peptidoglycan-associated lipoprotein Pal [Acidobacteria bacterium]|nr:peptidoglycan-associated lipoprotein Pal [Acidobacteriota bacterium]
MSNPALARRFGALLMIALLFGTFACKKKVVAPPPSPGTGRAEQPAAVPSGPTREPTVQIKADPSTIQPGGNFTLSWSSTDAERLTVDNAVGTVAPSGSLQLSPTQSTTYTAVATNRLGSATASTRVTVTEPAEPPPPPAAMDMEIEDIIRRGLIKDVFFDYDQYDLTPQAQETLRQNVGYLRQFANAAFILEGHCDERGTAEYNLALGDRRAQSVKEFLASLGVGPSRLETISYGEERPFAEGQDEAAWAQNRRVHFTLRR